MRIPVRSERDAYRITWATVVLVVASVVAGAVVSPIAGVVLFAVVVAGAAIWDVRSADPDRIDTLSEAARTGRENSMRGGRPRVLVVANQTLAGTELRSAL